ncbi:hypothetical protein V8D89_001056 [Ganoderma adspersum]
MALHSGRAPNLLCPDILVEILNYLQLGRRALQERTQTRRNRRICRKTLLACSLTCRTLSDIALDVLWGAMDNIRPLLQLLDIKPDNKRPTPRIVLGSRITPEAWTKLRRYATRVREIAYSSEPNQVHRSVWTFLAIQCEGLPLFPCLHNLEAREISLDDLSSLFLLLSPSLRSLYLSFKRGGRSAAPQVSLLALQHITQVAPHLSSFHMSGDHYITGDHVSILQNFSGLTDLSVGSGLPLNGPMLLQLSASSSIDSLSVSIRCIHSTDLQSIDNGFRDLHKLTIRGHFNDLIKFIISSHLPSLNELVLQVTDSKSFLPRQFCRRLGLICQHPGLPGSLTRIGCEFSSGITGARQDTLMLYLEPLLSFPLVEHCHILFRNDPPSICDGDLIKLGDAWGNLQSLEVRPIPSNPAYGWHPPPPLACIELPTLFGLTQLARRCPNLAHIHLPELDASERPKASMVPCLGHAIRVISFDDMRYASRSSDKPCTVAAVLDITFPKLNPAMSVSESVPAFPVNSASYTRPPTDSKWRTVMSFVHAMQLGRRHLVPHMDSGATSEADSAASMMGPGADMEVDFDLDPDSESEYWGPEPELNTDLGLPEPAPNAGLGWDAEELESEAGSEPDSRPESPLATHLFDSEHSDSDEASSDV